MKTIWKYPVPMVDEVTLEIPVNAEILTVQMQLDQPVLWALVESANTKIFKIFRWYGTGHPCAPNTAKEEYIGTIQWKSLVFHLFKA